MQYLFRVNEQIVKEGVDYHEQLPLYSTYGGVGRIKRRAGHNLLLRFQKYQSDVLRFLTDGRVPFTNNQAEQDIRMMKCKQKISGGFRSTRGAEIFICIRGFISTTRKQGWNVFQSLQLALRGNAPSPA